MGNVSLTNTLSKHIGAGLLSATNAELYICPAYEVALVRIIAHNTSSSDPVLVRFSQHWETSSGGVTTVHDHILVYVTLQPRDTLYWNWPEVLEGGRALWGYASLPGVVSYVLEGDVEKERTR
jgi:hypothetical protein